ncbi:MAG TPA: tripartite tricarboxylate transporter TctB family protein [Syntrophorhabdaceae bacterium]|nr:tripartite tricarboxylate transporter TctB family protein [Syntrophorhabdaceae bacterium]
MEDRRTTFIESITLFIMSFGVLFEGIRLTRIVSNVTQDIMGPGTYIIALGALFMLGTLLHSTRLVSAPPLKERPAEESDNKGAGLTVLAIVATLAFYTVCIQILGYLIATPIFFLLIFWVVRVESWRKNVTLTVILSAAYYLVFVYYCSVIFPRGIFYR